MTVGSIEDSTWTRQLPRWCGIAAIVGGLLWVLAAVLHSLEAPGCVGWGECTGSLRSASPIVAALAPVAAVLVLAGVAGLVVMGRRSGRYTGLAAAGLLTSAAGMALLLVGGLVQAVLFDGDFPGMPFFVVPGLLGVMVGFVLIGVFILRSGVLPRWLGIVLAVATLLLLVVNEQTAAVLLAVPFGLAMAAVGTVMWAAGGRSHDRTAGAESSSRIHA